MSTATLELPPRPWLTERLFAEAQRALLIGDLYLVTDPAAHDLAIALGTELASLGEEVEAARGPLVLDELDAAIALTRRAARELAPLAPAG
ncbi:MAG TPA: hypothetical protein DEA08_38850 [Planctomycetes bacterium]|nr:hypothetical protein [Planctomycetota bacterium]